MKISMLMPTYETPADLLSRAIDSVANQTHTDWEIVIKDGSEEKPAIGNDLFKSRLLQYGPRIKYALANDGPPPDQRPLDVPSGFFGAVNDCIRRSTGDVLSILCADDERGNPEVLEHVNKCFENRPEPFFLYGHCQWIDEQGMPLEVKKPINVPVTFAKMQAGEYPFYTPALFWNRAVHDRFGLFASAHYPWCADFDFWLRCFKGGMESAYVTGILGKYRIWEQSHARDHAHMLGQESSAIQRRHA